MPKKKTNYPYMVYVRFDENGKVESFQGRKNSEAREGETAFPPDWGGCIGDDINSFVDGRKTAAPPAEASADADDGTGAAAAPPAE
jgi:hypothetical protein